MNELLAAPSLVRSPKLTSTDNLRASNRAVALRSCNVLLFSRAPLPSVLAAVLVALMVLPLLSRDNTEVPLLRDSLGVVVEEVVDGESAMPRADLAARRFECF